MKVSQPWGKNGKTNILVTVLCVIVFIFYQSLIYDTPSVYWFDAHVRIALHNQLVIGQWLPLIQIFVVCALKITPSLYFLRSILSVLAIGSLISFYTLARHISSHLTGVVAIVFLSLNMMFAALATVPYPEVLFVGFSFLVFTLLDRKLFTLEFYIGLIILNLACLTRYEGWILSGIFIAETAIKSFRAMNWNSAVIQTIKMTLLCSATPLIWIIYGVLDNDFIERLWEIFSFAATPTTSQFSDHVFARMNLNHLINFFSQYFQLLNSQIHTGFLILGVFGYFFAIFNTSYRLIHWRILCFLFFDLCILAFIQPMAFGNLRQPFILQSFVILYAAYGLVYSISWLTQRISLFGIKANGEIWASLFTILTTAFLCVMLIPSTVNFVKSSSNGTNFLISYEIGTWLDNRLQEGDTILIIDDDFYPYALATYMRFPFEKILNDRLDASIIQENLVSAQMVYVVGLYTSRDNLSPTENGILEDLESGDIEAQHFDFDGINIWYMPANQINYLP